MQEEPANVTGPADVESPENAIASPPVPDKQPGRPFFPFTFNTILAGIALLGVIILYILHFTKGDDQDAVAVIPVQGIQGTTLSVVFVNTDSINAHYEFVKTLRSDLESTGKRLQKEVLGEQAALEKEAEEFQKQMASNQITEDKARLVYEQLMQRQQNLMEKKEKYTQQVAELELDMNIRLVDSVTAFLKRFNRQYGFDYILGYKTAGEILVANDTLDITGAVLDALNKDYQSKKK